MMSLQNHILRLALAEAIRQRVVAEYGTPAPAVTPGKCACGRTISTNKTQCLVCSVTTNA